MTWLKNPIRHPAPWLYLFIAVHIVAWTLVPYLTRYNLPMDALEGTIWGHQFEWGYDKNPFLNGWLTAVASDLPGPAGWGIYLFSQLSVAACFWAVWQLGKKMLPPAYALLAVLLLEGAQYYNLHAIDFNDNTLELGLWTLTSLFFYEALTLQTWRHWLLTGVFAALSMMTKYYSAMLLLPMGFFLLVEPQCRKSFFNPWFYAGLLTFGVIILPHIVWLFHHDFVTVNYALGRISSDPAWFHHINYSASFAWEQFAVFLPPLCLAVLFLLGKSPALQRPRFEVRAFDQQFLLYLGLGPLLLTVLLSALTGIKLRAGWGEPLLSLWGIMLIAWLQPVISREKFYRFAALFCGLFVATLTIYTTVLVRGRVPSSANFPGNEMAANLTQEWRALYHTPLPYIAGARWLAGNIAFYSPDHPAVYIDCNPKLSPWIDEAKMKQSGALFVWNADEENDEVHKIFLQRFQQLGNASIRYYSWRRNPQARVIAIGVAFLKPA